MKLSLLKQATLNGIASASCVEYAQGNIYVVGDDSHFMYVLKYDLSVLHKIPLVENPIEGRVPKKQKTDIECITPLTINGYPHLLLLGSGSKSPQRDKGYLIKLPTPYNKKHIVWPLDFSRWYHLLRMQLSLEGITSELNLEAAATSEEYVYIVNRGSNTIFRFDLVEMIEFVQGHMDGIPFPTTFQTSLPAKSNVPFQITGADIFEERFFFTATAENTDNAIDDGEIMGSLIGELQFAGGQKTRGAVATEAKVEVLSYQEIQTNIPLKVESIAVYEKENENSYIGLAVSDDDLGGSEILMLQLDV